MHSIGASNPDRRDQGRTPGGRGVYVGGCIGISQKRAGKRPEPPGLG